MARKKGTAVYLELVKKYCIERYSIESVQKQIDNYTNEIAKDEKVFKSLDSSIENYDTIKRWYEESVSIKKMYIGVSKGNMKYSKEKIEKYSSLLKNDYEEDLDALYAQNKPL
jgi:mannose/fructose/N-acetylgalactosamine-specific phosphotransferase system component IIB